MRSRKRIIITIMLLSFGALMAGWAAADSVNLPKDLKVIQQEAFAGNTSLDEIVLPDGLTAIEQRAFANSSVTRVCFPENLQTVADDAFENCQRVTGYGLPGIYAEKYCAQHQIPYTYILNPLSEFTFTFTSDNEAILTSWDGTGEVVSIPDMADETHRITAIGKEVFKNKTNLRYLHLPSTLTEIGQEAFKGCSGLTSIDIPDSVTILQKACFEACTGLTSVELPADLLILGQNAFRSCSALEDVVFNQKLKEVYGGAFAYCKALVDADLPDSVEAFRRGNINNIGIFWGDTSLVSFRYPAGLTTCESIDNYGHFDGCVNLKAITVPEGITVLPANVFKNAQSLTQVRLPSTLTEVGQEAFKGCSGLTSIDIPDSVTILQKACFEACTGLTSVELPADLLTLGQNAFRSCSALEDVVFNQKLKEIYGGAFAYCTALVDADLPDSVEAFCRGNINNIGIFWGDTSLVSFRYPAGLTICESIDIYNYGHFDGCVNLKTITVPEGITVLCTRIFKNAQSLTQVHLPSTLTEIGQEAFKGCSGLTSIDIPDSVTILQKACFEACTGLTSVELPADLLTLGQDAFGSCSALEDVVFNQKLKEIYAGAFAYCTALIDADLPDSVEAFCRGNINNIGIFKGDTALTHFQYPASLKSNTTGESHFMDCENLKTITVPEGITAIPKNLFIGAQYLEHINLPSTLTIIGDAAFRNCTRLQPPAFPDSLIIIDNYAFSGCRSMEIVDLPEGLTSLGQYSFHLCPELRRIYIPASATSLETNLFRSSSPAIEIWTEYGATAVNYAQNNNHAYYYLSLVGAHLPGTVYRGQGFNLYGSVMSTVPVITVSAVLKDSEGNTLRSITVHPGKNAYSLSGTICSEMGFRQLALGRYTLEISGSTEKSSEVFIRKAFSVKEAPFSAKLTGYNFTSGPYQAFTTDAVVSWPMEGTITANYPITRVAFTASTDEGYSRTWEDTPNTTVYDLAGLGFNANMLPLGHYNFILTAEGHGESVILDESRMWFDLMGEGQSTGTINQTKLNNFIRNKTNRQYFFRQWSEIDLLKDQMLERWTTSERRFLDALLIFLGHRDSVKEGIFSSFLKGNLALGPNTCEEIAKEVIKAKISKMSQADIAAIDYDGSIRNIIVNAFNRGFHLGSSLFPNYPGDLPDWLSGLIDIYNGVYDSETSKFEELNASYPSIAYVIGDCMAEYQKGMAVLDLLDNEMSTQSNNVNYFKQAVSSLKNEYRHYVTTGFKQFIKDAYEKMTASDAQFDLLKAFLEDDPIDAGLTIFIALIDEVDSAGLLDSSRELVHFLVLDDLYQNAQMSYQEAFDAVSNGNTSDSAVSHMTNCFYFTRDCGLDLLQQAMMIKETFDPQYMDQISSERIYELFISFRDLKCPYLD